MEELRAGEQQREHYFHFDPQHCAYAAGRAAYIRPFAMLRTGTGTHTWPMGK